MHVDATKIAQFCLYAGTFDMQENRIPNYSLYGEKDHWQMPEPMHCERIYERSSLHNWEIKPHRHDALLQILFLGAGATTVTIDGTQSAVREPCIVLISPMTVHGFDFTEGADGVVVMLDKSSLDNILASAPAYVQELQTSFILQKSDIEGDADGFRSSFDDLLQEYVSSRQGRLLALNAALSLILLRILRLRTANSSERASVRSQEEDIAIAFKDLVDKQRDSCFRPRQVTFFTLD